MTLKFKRLYLIPLIATLLLTSTRYLWSRVNYSKLDSLLSDQNWRAADEETWRVMQRASKFRFDDNFPHYIVRFPCKDLMTIDRLWVKHSNGHFGFSVQKRIWESIGGPTRMAGTSQETGNRLLKDFGDRVPWGQIKTTIDLSSPEGYLPIVGYRGFAYGGGAWWMFSLMERMETCKMLFPPNDEVFTLKWVTQNWGLE